MPIQRTDGCFWVTCSRCNKSMCFKCEPAKMIAYNDYNECYKHLNDVHGGYWWKIKRINWFLYKSNTYYIFI